MQYSFYRYVTHDYQYNKNSNRPHWYNTEEVKLCINTLFQLFTTLSYNAVNTCNRLHEDDIRRRRTTSTFKAEKSRKATDRSSL